MKTTLCIPTFNAAKTAESFIGALRGQTRQPDELLVIDSESDDNTVAFFREAGAIVKTISHDSFNHGNTRQLAVEQAADADILLFMTQDAILASTDSISNLIACFDNEKVGAVYARQLPAANASPIAAHARLFNYPAVSSTKSNKDISRLGIKSVFISNSFAAYRRSALEAVCGFPKDIIFGEDTYVAAKMLQAGWDIAYSAEATCYHSHNYSFREEFRRYFDIGVFHLREKWFLGFLGKAEGEGKRFAISEMKYLLRNSPWDIPSALLRTVLKYVGYKLGKMENRLLVDINKKLSMNKNYWKR
jgi:rhamnosyltransferase